MPTPRRRTPRSKIDEDRAHLLEELRAIEDTARPLIESYVTTERIEYLGGDPIVRRLNRLLGFFRISCRNRGWCHRFGRGGQSPPSESIASAITAQGEW